MFTKAIVRTPGHSMIHGLTTANLGTPDYEKALQQYQSYVQTLQQCGLDVSVLPVDENYPDSTFIEDAALLTPHCAIVTNPGAPSRKGETAKVREIVSQFYAVIEEIVEPGTIEAGDIMMVGNHYYIGISERTNREGAKQMSAILDKYGMTSTSIDLEQVLHLKTGMAYLEHNNLVVCGDFVTNPVFEKFNKIIVPDNESYAANCIWVNETVIMPAGYPVTRQRISALGYAIADLDMSEFQKLDGGLSCLSLRF